MTALVDSGYISRKKFPFNNFRASDLRLTSRAFGREPNALLKFCKCLMEKILAPRGGFEPPTFRLTAECSTIELPGNWMAICSNCSKILGALFKRRGIHLGARHAQENRR